MKIKNILVSQPIPASIEKSPFFELIEKHKVNIDFVPFIKVVSVTAKEFRSQRVDVVAHSAIIFSSRGNIDNFFKICEENRTTISDEMKYFCTTEAIALYLQKYIVYRKRKIFFGKGSFVDLIDILVKHKEEKFLVAVSEPHKPEISKALEKAKIKYNKMVLARTVSEELKGKIDLSKYDVAVFYSPSEINSLVANFPEQKGDTLKIANFGTTTASVAEQQGVKVSVLASTTTFPSMIAALDNLIELTAKNEPIDTTYISAAIKEENALNEQVLLKMKNSKVKKSIKTASTSSKKSTTPSSTSVRKIATTTVETKKKKTSVTTLKA